MVEQLAERRPSRVVRLGAVRVGGGAPISVQSMTNTHTADVAATLAQLRALAAAGCEIGRLAVRDQADAAVLAKIVKESPLPLVADIHFDYRLALASVAAGVAGLRLNPGNIGAAQRVREVAAAAKDAGIPIRVGVNGGSLEPELKKQYGGITAAALCESAGRQAALLEDAGFTDIKISLKASDLPLMIAAYRQMAKLCDYPLHIGVTEAGLPGAGSVKSALGIGILLAEGIGDTLRVSLTGDPVEEVRLGRQILRFLGLAAAGVELISCPTCGRTEIDLAALAAAVERELAGLTVAKPLKIAVMGCAVNGPGEASEADLGLAGGKAGGLIFAKGQVIGRYAEAELLPAFLDKLHELLRE